MTSNAHQASRHRADMSTVGQAVGARPVGYSPDLLALADLLVAARLVVVLGAGYATAWVGALARILHDRKAGSSDFNQLVVVDLAILCHGISFVGLHGLLLLHV